MFSLAICDDRVLVVSNGLDGPTGCIDELPIFKPEVGGELVGWVEKYPVVAIGEDPAPGTGVGGGG
jgi:hypothetical protein